MKKRPEINEYTPYYSTYIKLLPEGDLVQILHEQVNDTIDLLEGLTVEQANYRYAPDKWTIKEVIGHITDTERIMSYRLLSFARGETTSLPGYDDENYVQQASFNRLSMEELLENLVAVRHSTVLLLKSLSDEAWLRKGNANGSDVTVRALACIIGGHELHHRKMIRESYIGVEGFLRR